MASVTLSSINVADSYDNNLKISDVDYKEKEGVDRETSAAEDTVIPDMASSSQKLLKLKGMLKGY